MLILLLVLGSASLAIALITLFRPAPEGASAWFAMATTSLCSAIWIALDVLPESSGSSHVLAALVLGSLSAGAALWLRAGIETLRLQRQQS